MSWKTPIGEARINLLARRHAEAQHHAKLLAQIALDTDTPLRITAGRPAGDERTLRGIPAIGRSVAGAIYGSKPGANLK